MRKVLLVDNGSLKAPATLRLRELAASLSQQCGCKVDAVSLRFSDSVDPSKLNGKAAQIFNGYLAGYLEKGIRKFFVIPLFFSLSGAITTYLPDQYKQLKKQFGEFELVVGKELYPLPEGESLLTAIVFDNIANLINRQLFKGQNIVLVDHGSPSEKVTEVRQLLTKDVQKLIGTEYKLSQAVMERRSGNKYDFNGVTLAQWLKEMAKSGEESVVVAQLFLLPGKHAGKGGDIEKICNDVTTNYPEFKIFITELISDHPALIQILNRRLVLEA